jgi:hypothetical protein
VCPGNHPLWDEASGLLLSGFGGSSLPLSSVAVSTHPSPTLRWTAPSMYCSSVEEPVPWLQLCLWISPSLMGCKHTLKCLKLQLQPELSLRQS